MKGYKTKGDLFLQRMQQPNLSKEQIFDALFEACGVSEAVNTRHVFFQEVIIKFNASKASAVIARHLPYETESHYVDVALYAYIKAGYPMKNFEADLATYKSKFGFVYAACSQGIVASANA